MIKAKRCKNINDLLDKINFMGDIVNKPEYKDKKNQIRKELLEKMKVELMILLKLSMLKSVEMKQIEKVQTLKQSNILKFQDHY